MRSHSLRTRVRFLGIVPALILGELVRAPSAYSQGCMPGHCLTLSPGAVISPHLQGGEWEASITYRYLVTGNGYIGDEVWPNSENIVARTRVHALDLQATYALTVRYRVLLTVPLVYGSRSSELDHDGTRHTTRAGGLGDIRLVGHAWLLNPEKPRDGNISFGIGVKAPTGDDEATDTFYKPTGPENRPVDPAIQPGDGGWGLHLELAGYQKIIDRLHGYVSGFYLINPREENDTITTAPYPPGPNAAVRKLSVPDQYLGRGGLIYTIWPAQGIALSFGGRIDGVPTRDLIGGSEGFRRPGYAISVEPGVSWNRGQSTFSIYTPVMVYANREKNIYDDRYGTHGPAAFADFVIFTSFSRKF